MKKILLSLVLLAGLFRASAQPVTLTVDNNTPQYFIGTIVDNNWTGATPPSYMDMPNNMTSGVLGVPVQTGFPLASVYDWRGIVLRAYPSLLYYFPVYFNAPPYAAPMQGLPGTIPYNIDCRITGPNDIYIRFTP
ncbi:hypothetical protein [Taibaiella chishuiensis]|uniref:Uncharacterized protein n=1 Tax=Taibaiella chishuiensis TaxID=1434707 RepID=A0A2P8CYS1_9BACT|nr:hypothetical protein [Taibaiella chishuiensis]PSK90077.1 hypothetical protein B0I18_10983 [Taibaiella chishuiensis]